MSIAPLVAASDLAPGAGALSLLTTALVLGIRHGIDWDHIAAITDITSTTAAAEVHELAHVEQHRAGALSHAHGGDAEFAAHAQSDHPVADLPLPVRASWARRLALTEQRRALMLGTLYALGHALVVAVLGLIALTFGAVLPDWVDPILGRLVGVTLIVLGIWVFYSLYAYARHGHEFRLRSRWMLLLAWVRSVWRWFRARVHGHDHVDPVEASAYGARTAFAVGVIHGIGAETATQVLIVAAIGGAAEIGLGVPMMAAFIGGLLISNSLIVIVTAGGFVTSQRRQRIYVAIGVLAGAFSLFVGTAFLLGAEAALPDLYELLGFIG